MKRMLGTPELDPRKRFVLHVVEALYSDVGWDIFSVCYGKEDLKNALKDVRSEFPKSRYRVREYKPSLNK